MGIMGSRHAQLVLEGKVSRASLAAIADASPERLAEFPTVRGFADGGELIRSGLVDAVLIATPHFAHTPLGVAALKAGLHVLVEKPISVHKADCQKLLAAHKGRRQVFAAAFQMRTSELARRIHAILHGGELGKIQRMSWTITDWFRSDAYYASGGWRATWEGEGGGLLLNQAMHQLDQLCWFFGVPRRVRAFCGFGRYHSIEVEDDVTAWFEFDGGATGTFIVSTGEAPGTNRLEVAGTRGRLVVEDNKLRLTLNDVATDVFSRTTKEFWIRPPAREVEFPQLDPTSGPVAVIENFADAILDHKPLIAPAAQGLHPVELANAMLLSAWKDDVVELPISARLYARELNRKIAESARSRGRTLRARRQRKSR
jgi:predicted dehydrogenase